MDSSFTSHTSNQEQRMLHKVHPDSSYTVLSDAGKNIVHDLLAEARKDLEELDTNISAVEVTLHVLRECRTEKTGRIDRLQGRIAAHRRLPDELIAAIFVQCLQNGVVEVPPSLLTLPPWALSHVCSRWRGIALAEPLLWKRIQVPTTPPCSEDGMELTRHICSHRGGEGKIELLVSAKCRDDWENLLSLASIYPSRIHGLTLTVRESTFPHLGAPVDAFNCLESLKMLFVDDWSKIHKDHYEPRIVAFSLAHKLRKVDLCSGHDQPLFFRSWRYSLLFPWTQLTDLGISTIYPSICLGVLSECTQLLRFTVRFCPSIFDPIGPTCSVSLPHLHSLSIDPNEITNLSQFLDALVLPALKRISFRDEMGSWPQQSILGLLSRSGNAVESFESAAITSSDDFIGLMRAMPQLSRFVASAYSSNASANTIPETVLSTMNSENLVPKLRIFWGWNVSSIRTALDFLDSRWSGDAQGRYDGIRDARVYIEAKDLAPDQVYFLGSLDHLRMHGRKVEVRTF